MIQGGDFTKGDGESSIRVWTGAVVGCLLE